MTKTDAALATLDAQLASIGGCSDGYCVVTGPAKGMHTNGGCRCLDHDRHKARRVVSAYRYFATAIRQQQ